MPDEDKNRAVARYRAYCQQIALRHSRADASPANYTLRIPAGRTSAENYLVEFFHAFSECPTDELIEELVTATDIAATAIQSVLAPAIIQYADRVKQASFFGEVVLHDIENWNENVTAGIENIRDTLGPAKLTRSQRAEMEDHLASMEFDSAILGEVLLSLVWVGIGGKRQQNRIPLGATVDWIESLRHPLLADGRILVRKSTGVDGLTLPGETTLILANLLRNALQANQDMPPARIEVSFILQPAAVSIAVASEAPFDLEAWLTQLRENERSMEGRGLRICSNLLRAFQSRLTQSKDDHFGCKLEFTLSST